MTNEEVLEKLKALNDDPFTPKETALSTALLLVINLLHSKATYEGIVRELMKVRHQ